MMAHFDSIERSTGFQIPSLFRRMVTDGVTSYEKSPDEWLAHPPALSMMSMHVEWWRPEEMADFSPPDYYEKVFVPFAANGGGDLWCWYPESRTEGIVLVSHDEDAATHFAPDLEGFLFRHMVEGFAEIYNHEEPTLVHVAQANVKTLAPYLRPEWTTLLSELTTRPIVSEQGCFRFLTRKEAASIVERELAMPSLGKTFQYQKP